ncbi:uncharacterized protein LOC121854451 [Homarus americanus]|uniref:uncharacterized protein LOC121854451 n=1 Tax=Homarus americanus TaxID=6706 RepID=UPI001C48942E|nr:uncharacterized protein LOC121854451 [Homarus americanus]
MAYAQFEADKRTSDLEDLLEDPAMLQYMQIKLKEAAEEAAGVAETQLASGNEGVDHRQLSNTVVRLDALERMRDAIRQLEELQQDEHPHAKRSGGVSEEEKKRSQDSRITKRRSVRRRLRRGEEEEGEDLHDLFLENTREECPVLDRILVNCMGVSEVVGDRDQAFLNSCLRHEICYMCGASLAVSRHECDAVLSSSLEADCAINLDCKSAAGNTFNLLSNDGRYDAEGTCTPDPCVKRLLEHR